MQTFTVSYQLPNQTAENALAVTKTWFQVIYKRSKDLILEGGLLGHISLIYNSLDGEIEAQVCLINAVIEKISQLQLETNKDEGLEHLKQIV